MSSSPKTSTLNTTTASTTPVLPTGEPELTNIAARLGKLGNSLVPDSLPGFEPLVRTPLERPETFTIPSSRDEDILLNKGILQTLGERPGLEASQKYLSDEVSGKFLDPNQNVGLQQQIGALSNANQFNLQRNIGDTLARAGQSGAGGGSRSALLQGQAVGESNRGYSQAVGDLLGKAYGQNRLLQSQAPGQLINSENIPAQNTMAAYGLAGIPRQQQQIEQNARLEELSNQRNAQYQPLQVAQSILGQRLGQTIPIVAPGQNPMAGIAGLLSGLGGFGGGLAQLLGNLKGNAGSSTTGGGSTGWGLIGSLGNALFGSASSNSAG